MLCCDDPVYLLHREQRVESASDGLAQLAHPAGLASTGPPPSDQPHGRAQRLTMKTLLASESVKAREERLAPRATGSQQGRPHEGVASGHARPSELPLTRVQSDRDR